MASSSDKVIFVNSLFNLMLAMQLRMKMYPDAIFDIVISNQSSGLREAYENGYLNEIFNNVYFADYQKIGKMEVLRSSLSPQKMWEILTGYPFVEYNEVFFWNPTLLFQSYISEMNKRNKEYKLHLYADAMNGQYTDFPDEEIGGLHGFCWKKIHNYPMVKNMQYDYYMFCPEYMGYESGHSIIKIPTVIRNDEKFRDICNKTFGLEDIQKIKEKYLFLDTVHSENFFDKEEGIANIKKVIECVGGANLAIKPHPRQNNAVYDGLEITRVKSTFPFEIYCMNNSIDDKVLISYGSASSLLPYMLLDSNHKTIFYKVNNLERQHHGEKIDIMLQKLINKGKKIIVIDNTDDLISALSEGIK